ncbi:PREDICTED: histone deacetylase HDT3-like isoform X2 [Camelina sativa]|uniref:Histone deacetylase HDT3-like isoform X1 n=1 Tax=Camelina sativa TaxID=90675 RepID=A0ABM1QCQ2_CAMSA|nr:PREDICTED: histone deacetylase HDT3-like isoform X1 [Camelina sativa]XP_019084540.1 PREDICTED: histone deacetylase HDT3-like isoform X2 [Camelina sativa]
MEFWGVEVKPNSPLHVDPGEDMLVHISQAALGESKNNVKEPIQLFVKVGGQKLIIGNLSHGKFPQLSTELVLEKGFELSHNWKNGSVFFTGYKVDASDPEAEDMTDDEPAVAKAEPAVAASGVKQVNFQLPNAEVKAQEDDDEDDSEEDSSDDDDSSDESGDEEEKKVTAEVDSDEEDEDDSSDDDEDDSSEEDTPKKPEESKKRSAKANSSKNTASNKKAKFVTPQKTESKKPHVHIATPHPSKQAGKNSGGSSNGESSKKQQTPKSAGAFGCNSCSRTFTSEMGLQSHTKAKHSAAA